MTLLCKSVDKDISNRSIMDCLSLNEDCALKLQQAFLLDKRRSSRRTEIVVNDLIVNAEVSPFPDASPTTKEHVKPRFVVALKDITESRALQEAKQAAANELLVTKAMSDSMLTLTHELRTPLQGIMGICRYV